MANWNLPGLTDLYTNILTYLSARLNDAALMLDSATTTPTNLPVGAKRWNSTNKNWEVWSGTAWAAMASAYGIAITGNSNTATTLATARTINGVSFNGSANITINAVDATAREAAIAAGTTLQYWRGDKTWQTMPTSLPANGGTSAACSGNSATATTAANVTKLVINALGINADTLDGLHASAFATLANIVTAINDAHTFTNNGYQRLPSGLILQWGITSTYMDISTAAIIFPIAFPTAALKVSVDIQNNGTVACFAIAVVQNNTITKTGFSVLGQEWSGVVQQVKYGWIAIGY